ncbi:MULTISPECIES: HAMP domain-containing sensor histidine kinase [unclassified Sphingomonas]|uniref:sensor histidine kinase n=1 Tax=unclassified Sphingomonas TaxID=196159 RepID=UPI0025E42748|nr:MULTISPECIES: HAMP domain-containing sensor histidine kinase [unclassified Sphingomonas]
MRAYPRYKSLQARLIAAVMLPLALLVALLAGIAGWAVKNTDSDTLDRVLVGSVRTLSGAFNQPPELREKVAPLIIHLLKRRARPHVNFSVYRGDRVMMGDPALRPPADYRMDDGAIDRHPPAEFPKQARDTPMTRGYIDAQDADGVTQAAYLRDGTLHGRPARIATEMRRLPGNGDIVAIQIADYVDDQRIYNRDYYFQIVGEGGLVLLVAGLLVWLAIGWGLRPFAALTGQVRDAQTDPSPQFRLRLQPDMPRETVPFVQSFNALMTRLEKANQSLRQFTSNASHQMRTPLAVARVHLDVLRRAGPHAPAAREAIGDITYAVESLERLLLQLIALARTDEQSVAPLQPFDLTALAGRTAADRAAQGEDDGIDILFDAPGPVAALGDPGLAGELAGNLIDNAIRYNRPGGTVRVMVERPAGGARLVVEDDGPGIPEHEREKVWERFYRVAREGTPVGSGLGLPIVRALAERMGASIALGTPESGVGLRVVVDFRAAA